MLRAVTAHPGNNLVNIITRDQSKNLRCQAIRFENLETKSFFLVDSAKTSPEAVDVISAATMGDAGSFAVIAVRTVPSARPKIMLWRRGVTNQIWILHGKEAVLFAHLKEGSIPDGLKPGAIVSKGQLIGYTGNSGNSPGGPHLHMHVSRVSPALEAKAIETKTDWKQLLMRDLKWANENNLLMRPLQFTDGFSTRADFMENPVQTNRYVPMDGVGWYETHSLALYVQPLLKKFPNTKPP
jgi:hypothetical protein